MLEPKCPPLLLEDGFKVFFFLNGIEMNLLVAGLLGTCHSSCSLYFSFIILMLFVCSSF